MTRNERERLVEQYMEGSMDFAQEENFFIQVAIDEELRRTLKAYRIVEEAIRKEREVGAREHAGARRYVAGMLFAAPQPQTTAEKVQSASANNFTSKARKYGTRGIVMTIAAASVILFGWIGIRQLTDKPDATPGTTSSTSTAVTSRPPILDPVGQAEGDPRGAIGTDDSRATASDPQLVARNASRETPATGTQSGAAEAPNTQAAESAASESSRPPLTLRIDSTLRNPPRHEPVQLPVEIDWGSDK